MRLRPARCATLRLLKYPLRVVPSEVEGEERRSARDSPSCGERAKRVDGVGVGPALNVGPCKKTAGSGS
jgi:hypothetical protein